MKKIYKYSFLLLLTLIVSCSSEEGYADLTLDSTAVIEMSGDWYVQGFFDGDLIADYLRITTSNSASSNGTDIQIFDHKNFWWFNAAIPANTSALTFGGTDLDSDVDGYAITVTVTNGTVVKNGTTSTSGRTTDKIAFDIEFSDDPGSIYHLEGYKRTGFLEDEH